MIKDKISVVVPCFNEEKNIAKNIKKIFDYLKKHYISFEIIVSNDGSTDKTLEEINKISKQIPLKIISTPHNAGKGDAVKRGVLASSKDSVIVMFLDADLAIPINELNKFYNSLKTEKLDLAIASRFVPGIKINKPVLWYRKIMELCFRFLRSAILNDWQVKDSQCGFKIFRRSAAIKIFKLSTISRFAFDSEVIFLAKKFNFRIKELPITLCNPQISHIRIFADSINMFFSLFKIRINNLRGVYKNNFKEIWKTTIISADDFGLSSQANNNIIKLIETKKINRVAIMINRDLSKREINFLKKSKINLDLHLELPSQNTSSTKNVFFRGLSFYFKYLKGEYPSFIIKREWHEQILKFKEIFGKIPDGLNSHEHVHLFPPFFRILCKLARKNKIKYIRIGYKGQPYVNKATRHILQFLHRKNRKILKEYSNLQTSQFLISLDWIIAKKNPAKFIQSGSEIVCHPEIKSEFDFLKNNSFNQK